MAKTTKRKVVSWSNNKKGFQISNQPNSKVDFTFMNHNKVVSRLSLEGEVFEAFKEKLKDF